MRAIVLASVKPSQHNNMEPDIPVFEELELLEASFLSHEDQASPDLCVSDDELPRQPPSPHINDNCKRLRSPSSPNLTVSLHEEKKTRVGSEEQELNAEVEGLFGSSYREDQISQTESSLAEEEKIPKRYVSDIEGDFIPITSPSGSDRVYAKLEREDFSFENSLSSFRWNGEGLLKEPVNVLLSKLEREALNKAIHASSEKQKDPPISVSHASLEKLWVDKYAPKSFTELLSDEMTNREVLLWLKRWDPIVFGTDVRSTSDEVLSALRYHSLVTKEKTASGKTFPTKSVGQGWKSSSAKHLGENDVERNNLNDVREWQKTSKMGRPEKKILLLCGPPGLGKTTLAHVAAKHCGYRVVEINASDDRSTSVIEAKIFDVVQMNSVSTDSRPKCLVIDEIDGALSDGKGAVDVILKMVKSNNAMENKGKREQYEKLPSKKGRKAASLLRPVICICNDLYAPALRPLREVAEVHVFAPPTVTRIVNRLKFICNNEGMKINSIALSALAEYTECDIRSCLNTLQFLNRKNEALNVFEIGTQVVGRKDISHSAFDIWKEIFKKRKIRQNKQFDNRDCSPANPFEFLLSLVSNRGDFDCILDGIYENILQVQYHDPIMEKTVKCFNTLDASDLLHRYIFTDQEMSLLVCYFATRIHLLIAQFQKSTIVWPKSYQKCRTTQLEKKEILQSWQRQMPSCISRHLSSQSFVEDSISPFLHILSPSTLRPVALHLLTEKEKDMFLQLVNIMVSYAITYKNTVIDQLAAHERDAAAYTSMTLCFDPPFHTFIAFKDYRSGHNILPIAVKQVLSHEVEMQKIVNVSKCVNKHIIDTKESNNQVQRDGNGGPANPAAANNHPTPAKSTVNRSNGLAEKTTENDNLQIPGNIKKPARASANFFDRFRKPKDDSLPDRENCNENANPLQQKVSRPLIFKFNEGFTNAIKRPVKMREFLL